MRTAEVEFVAGSAEDVVVPLRDDDDAPVDLAGWAGRCEVRYASGHPLLLASWSSTEGSLRFEGSNAVLVVDAALAAASLLWTWRLAMFDLALRAPSDQDSRPGRPLRGVMRVIPPITITV